MGIGEFARRLILQSLDAILFTLRGSFTTTTLIECCINYAHGALPQYLCSQDLSLIDFAYYSFATTTHTELCLNYPHRVLPRLLIQSCDSTTLIEFCLDYAQTVLHQQLCLLHSFLHHALRALPTTGYHGLPQATTSSE